MQPRECIGPIIPAIRARKDEKLTLPPLCAMIDPSTKLGSDGRAPSDIKFSGTTSVIAFRDPFQHAEKATASFPKGGSVVPLSPPLPAVSLKRASSDSSLTDHTSFLHQQNGPEFLSHKRRCLSYLSPLDTSMQKRPWGNRHPMLNSQYWKRSVLASPSQLLASRFQDSPCSPRPETMYTQKCPQGTSPRSLRPSLSPRSGQIPQVSRLSTPSPLSQFITLPATRSPHNAETNKRQTFKVPDPCYLTSSNSKDAGNTAVFASSVSPMPHYTPRDLGDASSKKPKISKPKQRPAKQKDEHTQGSICKSCGVTTTPEWRKGPTGPRTLCNACGLLYAKLCKKWKHFSASNYEELYEPFDSQSKTTEFPSPIEQMEALKKLRFSGRAAIRTQQPPEGLLTSDSNSTTQ